MKKKSKAKNAKMTLDVAVGVNEMMIIDNSLPNFVNKNIAEDPE